MTDQVPFNPTFEGLEILVQAWARSRGIYTHSTPTAQLLKGISEMGELADAQVKNDLDAKKDAVGDVLVCLINYCQMTGISLVDCLALAYDTIKSRTGRMVEGGAFVKDGQ